MDSAGPRNIGVILIAAILAMAGCSGKRDDVRVTFCKEVTERILDSMKPIKWREQTTEFRKIGDAAIRLGFNVTKEGYEDRLVTSACFYEHVEPEATVLDHVDPLSSYATIPYAMTVQGKAVPKEILNQVVSAEQWEPVQEFIDQVQAEIQKLSN